MNYIAAVVIFALGVVVGMFCALVVANRAVAKICGAILMMSAAITAAYNKLIMDKLGESIDTSKVN